MNKLVLSALGALLGATIVLSASDSFALQARFCSKWATNYEDSDGTQNSDWDWESGNRLRYAQFARVKIYVYTGLTGWSYVSTQYLTNYTSLGNGTFCTPTIEVIPSATYRMYVETYLKSGNRIMVVMHDASTWSNPGVMAFYKDYKLPGSWSGTLYVATSFDPLFPNDLSKQSNVAHVGRQLMALADTLGWPNDSSERILVNMDPADEHCIVYKGCYWKYENPYHRICMAGAINSIINKFTAGHELGHAIAHMNVPSGPSGGAHYTADDPTSNSKWVSTYNQCKKPTGNHWIHSREYIGKAQAEGIAHFVSATLFNARSSTRAGFRSYREDCYCTPIGGTYGLHDFPWLRFSSEQHTMTNPYCSVLSNVMSGHTGLGNELDWAQFFWHVWATGGDGENWDLDGDLFPVWDATPEIVLDCSSATSCSVDANGDYPVGRTWEEWDNTAEVMVSDDQLDHMRIVSLSTGVNYNSH